LSLPAQIFLLTSSLLQDSQRTSTIQQNLVFANHQVKQEYATMPELLTFTIGGTAHSSRVAFAGMAVPTGWVLTSMESSHHYSMVPGP